MILDFKALQPPPPYILNAPTRSGPIPNLSTLPAHILLHIIYLVFPQTSLPDAPKLARQRRTLYWLVVSLRLVDRTLYAACMHVLRSTHIPAYDALVRVPYTSDPFPLLAPPVQSRAPPSPYGFLPFVSDKSLESPLRTVQRETAVLDKFIALKVREDVWADDSELHLERDEAYKDLFDYAQPRARLEDLVRIYGVQSGIICVGNPPSPFNEENINSSMSASVSNDTLGTSIHPLYLKKPSNPLPVPGQLQLQPQEPPTESKPRVFPPGSTYFTPSCSSPTSTHPAALSASSTSTLSLPLPFTRRISPKPSLRLRAFFKLKSKSALSPSSLCTHPYPSSIQPQPQQKKTQPTLIPISSLSVALAPRSVGLILSRRTVVSTPRTRNESLENIARRLVDALQGWVEDGGR